VGKTPEHRQPEGSGEDTENYALEKALHNLTRRYSWRKANSQLDTTDRKSRRGRGPGQELVGPLVNQLWERVPPSGSRLSGPPLRVWKPAVLVRIPEPALRVRRPPETDGTAGAWPLPIGSGPPVVSR
jgi:hypothetical protein